MVIKEGVKAGGLLWVREGLVLVRRRGSGRDGLVIPKGSPKPHDDSLAKTAEREVYEETGYRARAGLFLGQVCRDSIDVDSPERHKVIDVFVMYDGELDPSATPEEEVCYINPRAEDLESVMRYPQEAAFIAHHLAVLTLATSRVVYF